MLLEEKMKEWEKQGVIRSLWELKYERSIDWGNSVSDRILANCDHYRLLAWWNPIKWISLLEMQRLRSVGKRWLAKHRQIEEGMRNAAKQEGSIKC